MSKRTYEEYIKNGCHPVGYNEPCQRFIFSQISIDLLLDQIDQLKQQLAEKDKEIERLNTIIGLSQLQVSEKDRLNTSVNINSLQYNQTQLAITELEKVKDTLKHFCDIHSDEYYGVKAEVKGLELDVCEEIDNQIKVLKGE